MPNSPLLLPKLSPLVQKKVTKTREAINRLLYELYARQPSVIMVVATAADSAKVCSLLQAPKLDYSFAEWGDVVTKGEVPIATGFTHSLKERAETDLPLILKTVYKLPVTSAVPAFWLSQIFSNRPFVFIELPVSISLEELNSLSAIIREHCSASSERLLLVAAGNLAEQTGKSKDESQIYDKYFKNALHPLNRESLSNLDDELKKRVRENLWAPALLAALVVDDIAVETNILSYEAPAKVGYLVAQLSLS